MRRLVIGILAHVDAGKTTLSEGILYHTGTIRRLGRVDNRDAFLDTYELERSRGITIFSKQAVFDLGDIQVTLLDTPGHVDFSAEMERTLQVLDCAVLVISGADGVQGHTETLWRLLRRYRVPTFLFVNKMDQNGTDWKKILEDLRRRLDENCVPFHGLAVKDGRIVVSQSADQKEKALADLAACGSEFLEELAMCEEGLMEDYLEQESVTLSSVSRLIARRQVFPCYFGSALKLWGVEELLEGIRQYGGELACEDSLSGSQPFGARVFKISRDEQGNRMTHMKITSGFLKVKDALETGGEEEEKVNQIRVYSGAKYETVNRAEAGMICEVTGLLSTYAGQGLGKESQSQLPSLEPVLTYQVILPPGSDVHGALMKLRQLEEEEPMLRIAWNEELGEIQAQVMGEVQIEILKSLVRDRFDLPIEFGAGHIVYKETILEPVEGVGHYEPLRHYAEVHLLLEPGKPGSGLTFATACSSDVLDTNWQRLILTHLEEKRHLGVLTGSEITDMKITLIAGRAHLKHTEGGDFRQATYRAVRQGLREAMALGKCRLLEPVYQFRLEVPAESAGRALSDLERMNARFEGPVPEGGMTVITGKAPAAAMGNYQAEVTAYTRGRGRLSCSLAGYEPCHNEDQVLAASGYDPDLDMENSGDSVFCSHGAGYLVPWDMVKAYMHVESPLQLAARRAAARQQEMEAAGSRAVGTPESQSAGNLEGRAAGSLGSREAGRSSESQAVRSSGSRPAEIAERPDDSRSVPASKETGRPERKTPPSAWGAEDKELEAIFTRTYGERKDRKQYAAGARRVTYSPQTPVKKKEHVSEEEYLLVDGYNIIFAWEELRELAKITIDGARHMLMDIMCNYQGYTGCILILVFDAYKVEGNLGQALKYHNIHVVYTKEAETADQYIEKLAHQMGREHTVTVATSDGLEQLIIRGQGCRLLSAQDLREAVEYVNRQIRTEHLQQFPARGGNYLLNHAEEDLKAYLERVRLGKEDDSDGGETDKK